MSAEESSWRTPNFRQSVVAKIEEAIRSSGMPTSKNSMEMENHVFQKAKTKEEYLGFVARLILHVREMNSKKNPALGGPAGGGGQNMQNPIDALQTLARQGSGNQMMGLVPPQGPAPVTATNYDVDEPLGDFLPVVAITSNVDTPKADSPIAGTCQTSRTPSPIAIGNTPEVRNPVPVQPKGNIKKYKKVISYEEEFLKKNGVYERRARTKNESFGGGEKLLGANEKYCFPEIRSGGKYTFRGNFRCENLSVTWRNC